MEKIEELRGGGGAERSGPEWESNNIRLNAAGGGRKTGCAYAVQRAAIGMDYG